MIEYQSTLRANLVEYDLVPKFSSLVMLFATDKRLQLADTNQRKMVSMTHGYRRINSNLVPHYFLTLLDNMVNKRRALEG